jgi:hypothetical protein
MALILDGTNGLSDVDGSAATPAIRGSDANTGIFFPAADTIAFAEGGVESARFDSSGNLGIGTSSPSNLLDINFSVSGNNNSGLTITNTNNSGWGGSVGFAHRVESSGAIATRSQINSEGGSNNSSMRFLTTGGGTLAERARIDPSGNLLVGTTSAIASGRYSCQFNGAVSNGIVLETTLASTGTDFIRFRNSAGNTCGEIEQNGTTTVAYLTSSDYRLKENIQPMTGALEKVAALKPVTYKWKVDGSDGQGFIAHELQEVCPDAVSGEKDGVDADGQPKYQGIDTSFLVANLTAAIQEQQALIKDLQTRIEALEGTPEE